MKDYNDRWDSEEEEGEKKKRFRLFRRSNEDGPGVDKDEVRAMEDPSIINFFKLLTRKFGKLFSVNFLYIFGNFPIIFALIGMTGYAKVAFAANTQSIFPALYGTSLFEPDSPVIASLLGAFGRVTQGYAETPLSIILLILSLLVVFTFGLVNVGTTYIIRSMVREEPVFFWHDFFYAIKRNWKQALPMGIIDLVLMALIAYDLLFFNFNNSGTMMFIFLAVSWGVAIMYFFMRLYIYVMMITFDLSLWKIIKNAIYFSVLGFKRNIMALIGVLAIAAITISLYTVLPPLGILPLTIAFGLGGFIGMYCSYPKIKEIMIDPYYEEHPEERPEDL